MRSARLQSLKNALIYRALVGGFEVGRRIPLERSRRLGLLVGRLAHRVVAREREKALRSLATAFPDRGVTQRREIVRRCFEHLGISLFEIFWLPNLSRENLHVTTRIEGVEHLRGGLASGRGAVLFTGHCGNWEWMAATIALAGFEMNVIAREIYDPRMNDFIVASRARHGVRTIGRGSSEAAKEILKTLRRGAILGALIDQSIEAESADIDFFGVPASTPIGPARLAVRAGAVAIAGFIERRDGMQIVRFEEPIETAREMDPIELTRTMTRSIERQIRRVPDQWVWMHERWKRRSDR